MTEHNDHLRRLSTTVLRLLATAVLTCCALLLCVGPLTSAQPPAWPQTDSQGEQYSWTQVQQRVWLPFVQRAYPPQELEGCAWAQMQERTGSGGFGQAVAVSGDILVVGDSYGSGAAYIFYRHEGGPNNWGQVAALTSVGAKLGEHFGASVAVDGDTVVVGAKNDLSDAGAAYIFYRHQSGADRWGQVARLTAADGAAWDQFGWSVAIDGDTLVVGAVNGNSALYMAGTAYVFYRHQGGADRWGQVARLTAAGGAAWDQFGRSVGVDSDVIVVARSEGLPCVFGRNQGGPDQWGEVKRLATSDGSVVIAGRSVAISGDTIVVGAGSQDESQGAAYVFQRNQGGAGFWGQEARLAASDGLPGQVFGTSVAISGNTIAVGAAQDDDRGNFSGSVYLFPRSPGSSGGWHQLKKLVPNDGTSGDTFGQTLAVSGQTLVAGLGGRSSVRIYGCLPGPDLAILKRAEPGRVGPGDVLTYTIEYHNLGGLASTVFINDTLATGTSFGAPVLSPPGWTGPSVDGQALSWRASGLRAGGSGQFVFTATVTGQDPASSSWVLTNTATITAASDPDASNDHAMAHVVYRDLQVIAHSPAAHGIGVEPLANVQATFSADIDVTTVNSRTFAVLGNLGGLATGQFHYDVGSHTLTLDPDRAFHTGEALHASASSLIHGSTEEALAPCGWDWTAGPVRQRCFGGLNDTGINLYGGHNVAAAWGDYDLDGDLDVVITGSQNGAFTALYRNDGGTFTRVDAGLSGVSCGCVAWGDYDNDGDLDLLLAGDMGGTVITRIYRNDGSDVFTDIVAGLPGVCSHANPNTPYADLHGDRLAAWGDYDNDGDLDILLTGYHDPYYTQALSGLYRNDGEMGLAEVPTGLVPVGASSVSWGDYDNDGDLDILLTGSNLQYIRGVAKVYRNDGILGFADSGVRLPGLDQSSVSWGDYDRDGDLDVLMAGWGSGQAVSRVYRNDGGTFTDIGAGLAGIYRGSAAWGDADNDGDLDILLTGLTGSEPQSPVLAKVYRNDGADTFVDIAASLTAVRDGSATWADYDNDGDLDILIAGWVPGALGPFARIYRNDDCGSGQIIY